MVHRWLATAVFLVLFAGGLKAGEPCCYTPQQLIRMDACQLQEVYRNGKMCATPCGAVKGWAILSAGKPISVPRTYLTRLMWQGKEFSCDGTMMINRAFGTKMVQAQVFPDTSWFDGQPTLAFDYQCTSKLFGKVRDEVREICPGTYLGLTYIRKNCGPELVAYFVLEPKKKCGR